MSSDYRHRIGHTQKKVLLLVIDGFCFNTVQLDSTFRFKYTVCECITEN